MERGLYKCPRCNGRGHVKQFRCGEFIEGREQYHSPLVEVKCRTCDGSGEISWLDIIIRSPEIKKYVFREL